MVQQKKDLLLPTTINLSNHTAALMLLENDSHLWLSDNDLIDVTTTIVMEI